MDWSSLLFEMGAMAAGFGRAGSLCRDERVQIPHECMSDKQKIKDLPIANNRRRVMQAVQMKKVHMAEAGRPWRLQRRWRALGNGAAVVEWCKALAWQLATAVHVVSDECCSTRDRGRGKVRRGRLCSGGLPCVASGLGLAPLGVLRHHQPRPNSTLTPHPHARSSSSFAHYTAPRWIHTPNTPHTAPARSNTTPTP